jgi:hypothetical protein
LLVLFKVKAFRFNNKDKSHIFHAKGQLLLYVAWRHVCFEAICDRYFFKLDCFKLDCFKLIGWFYHHNVFLPIRSVCYRFLHCFYRFLHFCYRFLHCCYRFLHCCLWLTALKSTNHNRVIFICVLLGAVTYCDLNISYSAT